MTNLDDLTLEQLKEVKEAVNNKIKAIEEKQTERDKQEKQTLPDEEVKQRIENIAKSIDEDTGLVVLYKSKKGLFYGMWGKRTILAQAIGLNCLQDKDLFKLMTQSLIVTRLTAATRRLEVNNYH